jgi:hypothetical protein
MNKKIYTAPTLDILSAETVGMLAASVPVLGSDYDGSTDVLAPEAEVDLDTYFDM